MQLSLLYMNWNYFPAHYEGEERFFCHNISLQIRITWIKIFLCAQHDLLFWIRTAVSSVSEKWGFWDQKTNSHTDSPWQTPPLRKYNTSPPRGGCNYTYSNSSAGAGFNSPYYWLLSTPCTSLHHNDTAICNAIQGTQTGNWSGGKNNNLKEVACFSS